MYYDIFGSSQYLTKDLKGHSCSFQKGFENNFSDSNKIFSFLEATTHNVTRKFKEFALNPTLLTDPAKHTSFLDALVHFQFAMFLAGQKHMKAEAVIRHESKLAEIASTMAEKVDETKIAQRMHRLLPIHDNYYAPPPGTNPNDITAVMQDHKNTRADFHEGIRKQAIKDLDQEGKWRTSPQPMRKFQQATRGQVEGFTYTKQSITTIFSKLQPMISEAIQHCPSTCSTLVDAKKILETFETMTQGAYLKNICLFGKDDPLMKGKITSSGCIDHLFNLFNHSCHPGTPNLHSSPLATIHQEQLFLKSTIEQKFLTLKQKSRKEMAQTYPQILFFYLLNLIFFTLLIKDEKRKFFLGLDIKTWNAQLRLICHYIPAFFDNVQLEAEHFTQVQNLKSYFSMHFYADYFEKPISPLPTHPPQANADYVERPISPLPTHPPQAIAATQQDHYDDVSTDEWDTDDDATEA